MFDNNEMQARMNRMDQAQMQPSPDAVQRQQESQARRLADRLSGMKVGTGRGHLSRTDADNIAAMALRILVKGETA